MLEGDVFITGTDTGVGKTFVSCLLLEDLRRRGVAAVGYKPVASGGREDGVALANASGVDVSLDDVNPVWFRPALTPLVAGRIENRVVDFAQVEEGFRRLKEKATVVLVEGAGGWESPIAPGKTNADLALLLALPVVVVVNNRLGALNHTILTVRSIENRGLRCAGLVLNHVAEERDAASISNRAVLEEFLDVPILAELMHGSGEL